MELQSTHSRKIIEPQSPCNFTIKSAEMLVDIYPDKSMANHWEYLKFMDTGIQCGTEMSAHEVNTENVIVGARGVNHLEGGWPRDVNPDDAEQVARFKKKIEKSEPYLKSLGQLGSLMEPFIKENISLNIYENYFVSDDDDNLEENYEESFLRTSEVLRDPEGRGRSICQVSWCLEDPGKLAAAYCSLEFQTDPLAFSPNSYVWDLEVPITPKATITPDSPLVCIEYCPKDLNVFLGGCYNGQIVLWDQRRGKIPVESTPMECSHTDPVYGVLWVYSKGATECLSASSDGKVLWWDVRKLSSPTDCLVLDNSSIRGGHMLLPQIQGSYSATCLEYESTMPARFMVGTEEGAVLSCNRKAKSAAEKITCAYLGHAGPIYTLQRNSLIPKVFLTVGDYTAQVWSEEVKESSIITLQSDDDHLTSGCWIPSRPSCLAVSRESGEVDIWDLLYSQTKPMLTMKVSDDALSCMWVQEQSSRVACGGKDGSIYLLQLSKDFTSMHRNDKLLITALLERETQREKVMESRCREQRLHERLRLEGEEAPPSSPCTQSRGGLTDNQLLWLSQLLDETTRDFQDTVLEAEAQAPEPPLPIPEFE